MEKPNHIIPDEAKEFPTEERCHILELIGNHSDQPMSIARARVTPQVTTAWHRLINTDESYYILSGTGMIYLGEHPPFRVRQGELIHIEKGQAQRICNDDLEEDLVFLVICTPAFKDINYESLE